MIKLLGHITFRALAILLPLGFGVADSLAGVKDSLPLRSATAREVHISGSTRKLTRESLTITKIDSSTVARYAPLTMVEFLQANTPIYIKSSGAGTAATASFRGTDPSHTQVEWNGVNVNDPMMGEVDFSMLPMWMVDDVELLHGGSSLQEGAGALGGTVKLNSRANWGTKLYGSAATTLGSFSLREGMVSLGGGGKSIHVQGRYVYERSLNNFEFVNTAIPPFETQQLTNADYQRQGATVDLNSKLGGNHFLDFSGWYSTLYRDLPAVISYQGRGRIENQAMNQWRGSLAWRWYGKSLSSNLTLGLTSDLTDYYQENLLTVGSMVNYDNQNLSNSLQLKYRLEWALNERNTLQLLVNAQQSEVSSNDWLKETDFSAERFDMGLSVSWHHQFSEIVSSYILARYENPTEFIPSVGVQIKPLQGLYIRVNGTRNYHKPTLNDLYWIPGGNKDLVPEKGITGDLNIEYKTEVKNWSYALEATAYISQINDWIMWQPSNYYFWMATNNKQVLSRGVEARAQIGVEIQKFSAKLALNYAYTRTTNTSSYRENDPTLGKQLIYIPIHKANAFVDLNYGKFYARWSQSFVGERYTTTTNNATRHALPAYLISDISFGFRGWGVDVALKTNNLFDESYQTTLWRPMPGRNFAATVRYTF